MRHFELFDAVELTEEFSLGEAQRVAAGTRGAIVEVLSDNAYLVELFGSWVHTTPAGCMAPTDQQHPDAFVETIGLATVQGHQIQRVQTAQETVGDRVRLYAVAEALPERYLQEVIDFAHFLQTKV